MVSRRTGGLEKDQNFIYTQMNVSRRTGGLEIVIAV